MQKLLLKYQRLRRIYQRERYRAKTHYQIILELLAKFIPSRSASIRLIKLSLRRHGIWAPSQRSLNHSDILGGRFFVNLRDEEIWVKYRSHFAEKIQMVIDDAKLISRHEFDLLGSGTYYWGNPIDWHVDPVSGYHWPKTFSHAFERVRSNPTGADIKFPWELSRMQHLPTLGKAYQLTQEEYYAREIVAQLTHWLNDNPCPYGVNWTHAMDVAIRIMNITWAYLYIKNASVVTKDFRACLATAIFQHAQFILFNLEYGVSDDGSIINGNHYLSNIVGLLHLGLLCPEFTMAGTWKQAGLKALVEEMDRQVLSDGGHFESSLSYHRLVLELFVSAALLCRANNVTLPQRFWTKLEKMFELVLWVTKPDGKVPQVGDADDGRLYILSDYGSWDRADFRYLLSIGAVLFQRSDMKAYAGGFCEEAFWLLGPSGMQVFSALQDNEQKLQSREFRESGLYVMRSADKYFLACCGMVSTAGIGSHKHNDLLSFELYAGDKAFIVDPGSYIYTRYPEWRNAFRSTGYHNTVVIDGQEQNRFEPKHLFKWLLMPRLFSTAGTARQSRTGWT